MTGRHLGTLIAAAGALTVWACGGTSPTAPTLAAPSPVAPGPQVMVPGRVAIISIDGLRPDAILTTGAPNILALAARGAYTWNARTVMPSTTLPSHISMLSGVEPGVHGIVWDNYEPSRGLLTVPTIFSVARMHGRRTAMIAGKAKFTYFCDTGACDVWTIAGNGDDEVAGRVAGTADLLFVHLPDVDLTGHKTQWMSDQYLAAVHRADQIVGRIVSLLPHDTTVILSADHGGHQSTHGTSDAVDVTIPWIVAGPYTARGKPLSSTVRTVDTAATAAHILGIPLSPSVSGRPVIEAFAR